MPTQQILLASAAAGTPSLSNPFVLQLDAGFGSTNVVDYEGDTTSEQSTWWGTQTYDNTVITNIGEEQYQGFYAFTLGKSCTISATLGGAGGHRNCRGRSIRSDFVLSSGTRVVFFAGKMGEAGSNSNEGAGGGASCFMTYVSGASSGITVNGFTPLVIAGGGGEASTNAGVNQELSSAAPPLNTSLSNINSTRNTSTSASCTYYTSNDYAGGVSRAFAQGGGSGWKSGAVNESGTSVNTNSVGLAYGAVGNEKSGQAKGGFGGGGYGYNGNFYGAGGGGLYGGFEGTGCTGSTTTYEAYTGVGNTIDNRLGALSYAASNGTNTTDNGLWGSASDYRNSSFLTPGRVYLSFS